MNGVMHFSSRWTKRVFSTVAPVACTILAFGALPGCSAGPSRHFARFMSAHAKHDIATMLAYYADDFELSAVGYDFRPTKAEMPGILVTDMILNSQFEYTILREDRESVTILGREENDYLRLSGLGEVRYRVRVGFRGGLMTSFTIEEFLEDSGPVGREDDVLRPFLAWAAPRYPGLLKKIRGPDGTILTPQTAGIWKALLELWREAKEG